MTKATRRKFFAAMTTAPDDLLIGQGYINRRTAEVAFLDDESAREGSGELLSADTDDLAAIEACPDDWVEIQKYDSNVYGLASAENYQRCAIDFLERNGLEAEDDPAPVPLASRRFPYAVC